MFFRTCAVLVGFLAGWVLPATAVGQAFPQFGDRVEWLAVAGGLAGALVAWRSLPVRLTSKYARRFAILMPMGLAIGLFELLNLSSFALRQFLHDHGLRLYDDLMIMLAVLTGLAGLVLARVSAPKS